MRIALADDDAFMRDLLEAVVTSNGHEVAGIADTAVTAVALIEAGRPDAVILDLSVTINTDFDIIAAAIDVGARVIVFSRSVDADLDKYSVSPTVVAKPDLTALEHVLVGLDRDSERGGTVEQDRRQRPTRSASGPTPTGVGDAQAFFEAINDAQPGDVMVSIEVSSDAETVAKFVARIMRGTDRLLAFPKAVRFYLPGGGEESIRSLLRRASDAGAVPPGCRAYSIIVTDGEHGADAFDRLKTGGEEQPLPAAQT